MALRKGLSIDDVRDEMAALEVAMMRLDPNDHFDETDMARYLALKGSRQHQLDELRFLRQMRHHPCDSLADVSSSWTEKIRCAVSRAERGMIREAQRALKTAKDIGPRETSLPDGLTTAKVVQTEEIK